MEKIEPVALAKALRKVWKTSSENSLLISQAADAIDALQADVRQLNNALSITSQGNANVTKQLAASKAEVERLTNRINEVATDWQVMHEQLAAVTKERDEAVAKVKWFEGEQPSIAGWPWDSPYMDGVEIGKREAREQLDAMTKEREEAAAIRARGGDKR